MLLKSRAVNTILQENEENMFVFYIFVLFCFFLQKAVSLDILCIYQNMKFSHFHKKKHDSILYEYSLKQSSYINQYIQFYMFWPDKHFSAGTDEQYKLP